MYPDAGGLRNTMRGMGEHLAGLGYVTLVPDIYYRHGEWAPFEMGSVFADPGGRERIMRMVRSVTADMAVRDARAYADYLLGLPETTGTAIGTTGYCMGGRLSLIVAGHLGDRIAAAASSAATSLPLITPTAPTTAPPTSPPPSTSPVPRTTHPSPINSASDSSAH